MNVNYTKLINLLLPTFMRAGLARLVAPLGSQLQQVHSLIKSWQIDMRLQAAMTYQVMYLEAIINYRLLGSFIRTIYISDGDGVIVDFIVNVPSSVTVDSHRLIALIEKYKTYGKRYSIAQSQYVYEIEWTEPACEQKLVTYTAAWDEFMCEQTDELTDNNITLSFEYGSQNFEGWLRVTAAYPVASDVWVNTQIEFGNAYHTSTFHIIAGTTMAEEYVVLPSEAFELRITEIIPASDEVYRYLGN